MKKKSLWYKTISKAPYGMATLGILGFSSLIKPVNIYLKDALRFPAHASCSELSDVKKAIDIITEKSKEVQSKVRHIMGTYEDGH